MPILFIYSIYKTIFFSLRKVLGNMIMLRFNWNAPLFNYNPYTLTTEEFGELEYFYAIAVTVDLVHANIVNYLFKKIFRVSIFEVFPYLAIFEQHQKFCRIRMDPSWTLY